MTGLIPAAARQLDIACLFTVHSLHTTQAPLACIEDSRIDAASLWQDLYDQYLPFSCEETGHSNPLDFLVSGVFAARHVNPLGYRFLNRLLFIRRQRFMLAMMR